MKGNLLNKERERDRQSKEREIDSSNSNRCSKERDRRSAAEAKELGLVSRVFGSKEELKEGKF